jgi:hypothetical protein
MSWSERAVACVAALALGHALSSCGFHMSGEAKIAF